MESELKTNSLLTDIGKGLDDLTEQNWLFIKYFLATGNVKKSHQLAGYKGTSEAAPYMLFKQLKGRIEDVGSLDITSRSRILAEVNKLLEIPLDESVKTATFKERTKLLEVLAKLTPDAIAPKQQLSVFVIKRYDAQTEGEQAGRKGKDTIIPSDSPQIIDVDPIP